MIQVKYVSLVMISLLADLLNFFLAPIVSLFANQVGWLPNWLSWFQTPDNSLDGDGGWQYEHRPYKTEDKFWHRWWNRTRWLHRNSMYGFAINVLGVTSLPTDQLMVVGDPRVSNRPLFAGLVKRYLLRDNKVIAFQWYYVKPWSEAMCIRINFGWKLWDASTDKHQLVFSPSFTMGYSN